MGNKEEKTNVMRTLEQKKLEFEAFSYDNTVLNAVKVAECLNTDVGSVFKTLVTVGRSGSHYVFMVPAAKELDLKAAAKACGEKSVEMIPQKELLSLTGYVHGGCSPIGMKKFFPTFIDSSALNYTHICFSGGKPGRQVRTSLENLLAAVKITVADIAE